MTVNATFESTRSAPTSEIKGVDTILPPQKNRVEWYFRTEKSSVPQLDGLTFGAAMEGDGLVTSGSVALQSAKPEKALDLRVHPLTAKTATPAEWESRLEQQIEKTEIVNTGARLQPAPRLVACVLEPELAVCGRR